jgi:boron transporter
MPTLTPVSLSQNNVSAVMAQARHFPVKRPAGFHWDFFLLGCTTFVAGILGLPAPNGLVPQAPVHTEALSVTKMVPEETVLSAGGFYEKELDEVVEAEAEKRSGRMKVVRTRLVEQRLSHLVMGVSRSVSSIERFWLIIPFTLQLLTLGTMSRPLLVVL